MIKRFYRKKKAKRDLRFVDAEVYRAQRKPSSKPTSSPIQRTRSVFPNNALDVNYMTGQASKPVSMPHGWLSNPDKMIKAYPEESILIDELPYEEQFLEDSSIVVEEELDLLDFFLLESKKLERTSKIKVPEPRNLCEYSLGVFSDSRMYSALIRKELQPYQLNIKHFNHPRTFESKKHMLFDQVSAWILFLSDDGDEDFLDRFIERYYEKPTLFLCPKMTRKNTTERIASFISEYELEKPKQPANLM